MLLTEIYHFSWPTKYGESSKCIFVSLLKNENISLQLKRQKEFIVRPNIVDIYEAFFCPFATTEALQILWYSANAEYLVFLFSVAAFFFSLILIPSLNMECGINILSETNTKITQQKDHKRRANE